MAVVIALEEANVFIFTLQMHLISAPSLQKAF